MVGLIKWGTVASVLIAFFSHSVLAEKEFAGFLGKKYYDQMEKVKTDSGLKVMRWVSPKFSSDDYDTALVDDVVFYPKAEPSELVSQELLDDMQAYLTKQLKSRIANKVTLVEQPQKGAVRVSAALTGVKTDNENMKPWEIVPVAAVIGIAQAASGHRDQDVHVFLEVKVSDSVSGEVLVAIARELQGKELKNKKTQATMKDVSGDLDKISGDAEQSLDHYVN